MKVIQLKKNSSLTVGTQTLPNTAFFFFSKATLQVLFSDLLQVCFLNHCFQSRATSREPNLFSAAVQNQFFPDEMCIVLCCAQQSGRCISLVC